MNEIKIRELNSGELSDNNDYFVVALNNGTTVKISYAELASFLLDTSLVQGSGINITDVTEQDGIVRYQIQVINDDSVTSSGTNSVKGSGVYSFVNSAISNAISGYDSGRIVPALNTKQDTLTFDTVPTQNSNNPVTSDGVYKAIQQGGGGGNNDDINIYINAVHSSGAWGGTYTIEENGHSYTLAAEQNLNRFSHYWTGSGATTYPYGFWQWITAVTATGVYYNLVNNDGHIDCIKFGDYIVMEDMYWSSGNACARIIGINTYTGIGDVPVGNCIDWEMLGTVAESSWLSNYNQIAFNNGAIPVASLTSDGSTSTFYLSWLNKSMNGIGSADVNGIVIPSTNYTLTDNSVITFTTPPPAGTLTVRGWEKAKCPWLSSRLYGFLNSMNNWSIPSTTSTNPDMETYTFSFDSPWSRFVEAEHSGVYIARAVIEKRMYIPERYSDTQLATLNTGYSWQNIGKIWTPTVYEMFGYGVDDSASMNGCKIQYPLYRYSQNRIRHSYSSRTAFWLLDSANGNNSDIYVCGTDGNLITVSADDSNVNVIACFRTGTTFSTD